MSLARQLSSTVLHSKKNKVVILGCGWGGFRLARVLNKEKFSVTLVSPRNHFVFTPLLPSSAVGTLEFRCVQEPVRTVKGITYYQAAANTVDFEKKEIICNSVYDDSTEFTMDYDKLIIAVGTKSNTFGVPGVETDEENIIHNPSGTNKHNLFFLKQIEHARSIRNRIIECFERASSPFCSEEDKKRLLTFLVVGGGPTSIEFASEMYDFLKNDVKKWYPDLAKKHQIIIVEAGDHLLGSFNEALSKYVEKKFTSRNITTLIGESVQRVEGNSVVLKSGKTIPYGACVWSTGNKELDFVKDLGLNLDHGRIVVDSCLRVSGRDSVYAIGDCARIDGMPLAMLAQVANQQGKYLGKSLNSGQDLPFRYFNRGAMAQLGTFDAVVDMPGGQISGLSAFITWRLAYLTLSVSIANKMLIPMYWFKSYWFGRDISKF